MHKTSVSKCDKKIMVDIAGLQEMLSVGKNTADSIGHNAGAIVRFGKRKLYNVKKIEEYIDRIAEG